MYLRLGWLCVAAALLGLGACQSSLSVSPDGDQVKAVTEGSLFTCSATGSVTGLAWFDPDQNQITDDTSQDVHVQARGNSIRLKFSNIQRDNAGIYYCRATGTNDDGTTQDLEATIKLIIFEAISFVDPSPTQTATVAQTANLVCQAAGEPVPEVNWYRNGVFIANGGRFQKDPDTNSLQIVNVTLEDEDTYTCEASQPANGQYDELQILLDVQVPPTLVTSPSSSNGTVGMDVTLICQATGDPNPTYSWFRDSTDPSNELTDERFVFSQQNGVVDKMTMTITALTKADEGKYICQASNGAGQAEAAANVFVYVPPSINEPQDTSTPEGQSVDLRCSATGDPTPMLQWKKGGGDMVDGSDPRFTVSTDPNTGETILTISQVTYNDRGSFTCIATNLGGTDQKTLNLDVQFKPKVDDSTPAVAATWVGNPVNLTCSFTSNPTPDIKWSLNNIDIQEGPSYAVFTSASGSTLQVIPTDDGAFGMYNCTAANSLGTANREVLLKEAVAPEPPSNVRTSGQTPTSVKLAFDAPMSDGGVPVKQYIIQYSVVTDDNSTVIAKNFTTIAPAGTVEIPGLTPQTPYKFNVVAVNDVGTSDPSDPPLLITTEEIRVPYKPAIINDSAEDSTQYTLKWQAPNTGGSALTQYTIKYRPLDSDGDFETVTVTETGKQSYIITGLSPLTTYEVQLTASNNKGESAKATIQFRTGEPKATDKPGIISRRASDGGLGTGGIVAVVIVVLIILLIVIDVACYFTNQCGLTMFVCVNLCGKAPPGGKAADAEEGTATYKKEELQDDEVIESLKIEKDGADKPLMDKPPSQTSLKDKEDQPLTEAEAPPPTGDNPAQDLGDPEGGTQNPGGEEENDNPGADENALGGGENPGHPSDPVTESSVVAQPAAPENSEAPSAPEPEPSPAPEQETKEVNPEEVKLQESTGDDKEALA
ncbi:neural cell adhesion molecule 2-like isoform X2 [Branchiostoma floridae]|uniref:Neural cell adhesion molecule 2-like isoform X2 n=1 Tax=Branchiostoma floridae TaxID=7739 RepID=A0A9J7N0W9_BRAFL|nr:neural cell adhesion molecule 2-like isoform X2 [Branchiostoma floridae]